MGCGASHEGGFRRGWKRDPMADPRDRAAQRREWEQRQDVLCKKLFCTDSEGEDPDDDEVAAARAREEAERCGTFAWAPESTSSPPEKKNLWLHRSTAEEAHRAALALLQAPDDTADYLIDHNNPQPIVWTENTPGRFRSSKGTGPNTKWDDNGDAIPFAESLEARNARLDRADTALLAELDGEITALKATIEELGQKIPALETDRKNHLVARNFEALPGLRQEAAEAQARLGRAKASLKKKQAARASTIKGMAARVKPPLETRWVPRFRSPTLDT